MADLLYVVVQEATHGVPTAAQIKAGQNGSGTSAAYSSSTAVSSTDTKTFSVTGLTEGTAYESFFIWSDGSDDSNLLTGQSFTTTVDITPDALAATGGVFEPSVTGEFTIQPDAITASGDVYEPTFTTLVSIAPDLLTASGDVYEPTFTTLVSIFPALITRLDGLYEPDVFNDTTTPDTWWPTPWWQSPWWQAPWWAEGTQSAQPGFLSSFAMTYEPTMAPGAVAAEAGFVAATSVVYEPVIDTFDTILPPFLASSEIVYAPASVGGEATITPALITDSTQVFDVELPLTITQIPFIASFGQAYDAILSETLFPAALVSSTALYEPVLVTEGGFLQPGFLAASTQVFDADVFVAQQTAAPDFIDSATAVYDPTITGSVTIWTPVEESVTIWYEVN